MPGEAQQAQAGRAFTCAFAVGGWLSVPHRGACADAGAELRDTQPPLSIKLKDVLVVAQVWAPTQLIAEFTGPLTASEGGQAPLVTATWGLAQASVRGTPSAPERASVVIDGLKLDGRRAGQQGAVRRQARRVARARAVRLMATTIRRSTSR